MSSDDSIKENPTTRRPRRPRPEPIEAPPKGPDIHDRLLDLIEQGAEGRRYQDWIKDMRASKEPAKKPRKKAEKTPKPPKVPKEARLKRSARSTPRPPKGAVAAPPGPSFEDEMKALLARAATEVKPAPVEPKEEALPEEK